MRPLIYTEKTELKLPRENVKPALESIKRYFIHDEETQKRQSLAMVFNHHGWNARLGFGVSHYDGISGLIFNRDIWNSSYETILRVAAEFIEPGGYIRMIDNTIFRYWAYKFDGQKVVQNSMEKVFIDHCSEKDLLKRFDKVVYSLFKQGVSPKTIKILTDKIFARSLFKY
jgi:hypothetical protein